MARLDSKGNYVPNKNIKVRQATIDAMNKRGMEASLAHANSGKANEEEIEAARRFYGKKVTGSAAPAASTAKTLKATTEKKLPRQPLPKPVSSASDLATKRVRDKNKYAVRAV